MVFSQRRQIGVSVVFAVIGVALLVTAFATNHWIDSNPKGIGIENGTDVNKTLSSGSESKYTGNITFGLFTGYKSMDYGLGLRKQNLIFEIKCDAAEQVCALVESDDAFQAMILSYKNQTNGEDKGMEWFGLFSFPLYVMTVIFLVLAMVWGLVAIGFAVFNVFGRPIETITGPSGLYLWNFLALLSTVLAIVLYLVLYFTQLKENILTENEIVKQFFTSKDLTDLDYSFYLVVGAAGSFVLNLVVLLVSGHKCSCSYSRSGEKEVDNGMILY